MANTGYQCFSDRILYCSDTIDVSLLTVFKKICPFINQTATMNGQFFYYEVPVHTGFDDEIRVIEAAIKSVFNSPQCRTGIASAGSFNGSRYISVTVEFVGPQSDVTSFIQRIWPRNITVRSVPAKEVLRHITQLRAPDELHNVWLVIDKP